MGSYCPGCGIQHDEDDDRVCADCAAKALADVRDHLGNQLAVGDRVVTLRTDDVFHNEDYAGQIGTIQRFKAGRKGVSVDVRNDDMVGWFSREDIVLVSVPPTASSPSAPPR